MHLKCRCPHMCVLIQSYNKLTITTSIMIIKLLIGFKWQLRLWIHNCINAILGGCLLRQAGQPWGALLLSGRIPQTSFLWGLAGGVVDTELFGVCVGLFWGVGHCSGIISACFRSRRPLFILGSVKEVHHVYHVVISIGL